MPPSDYLREIDLNPPPAMGGPVTSPNDPRAMHYFGFLADGQELSLVPPTGGPMRVLASFAYANAPLPLPAMQPPPVMPDAVLDFTGVTPGVRYELNHERHHVHVWIDSSVPPPTTPIIVRIRAWRRAGQ